ncbi:MAG: acyl-CoA dehydrogenase family protein [Gemmatimonadota bacterium]|nr:acyl-CoA dehydrogenase family protein [Gemmatimonadota bacterium]
MSEPDKELPSFCKSLFGGVIDVEPVFPFPRPSPADAEALEAYLEDLRRFLDAKVDGETFDREAEIPEGVIAGLAERGMLGASVPQAYDGMGFSQVDTAEAMAAISARDGGLAVVVGAHLSIGLKGILLYGTDEQKRRWLPRCARGDTLAAFALTEPGHGSDAAHIESRAERDGDRWILQGHKIWIGNAHRAGVIVAFAQTPVERDGETVDRVTAFVLDGHQEGIEVGRTWSREKLGVRSSTQAELFFRDVVVHDDQVLGEVGEGFEVAMNVLNGGRLGAAAFAVGGLRRMRDEALGFAAGRSQFGQPIAEFELIQQKLARIEVDTWVSEALVRLTARLVDRGDVDYSLESAICKVFVSEAAWRAADDALQIAGGRGYMTDRPFERFLRDVRVLPIFEGTNEVLRIFIALAGMEKLADWLEGVGRALREPMKELGVVTEFAFHRIKDAIGTPRADLEVADPLEGCVEDLERFVGVLHGAAERAIRIHREALVERQLDLARLADMAIDLYALTAAIGRAQARIEAVGVEESEAEIDLVHRFCFAAGRRLEANRTLLDENDDARVRAIAGRAIGRHAGATG